MVERTVSIEKLGSLSNDELHHLAVWLGVDAPPDLERPFLIDELTEAMLEDSEETRELIGDSLGVEGRKFSTSEIELHPGACSDELPGYCPQTSVRLFSRDPVWAYACWDLSEGDRTRLTAHGVHSLTLRLCSVAVQADGKKVPVSGFDIPVAFEDTEWYLTVPEPGQAYVVELCSGTGERKALIARSNFITAPRNSVMGYSELPYKAQALLELSGLDRFVSRDERHDNPQRIL